MGQRIRCLLVLTAVVLSGGVHGVAGGWNDETHIAIARMAGYEKWYNAAGADMAKLKAGDLESGNHYVNNPPDGMVTPQMVLEQAGLYDTNDQNGHLYGAILASLRKYRKNIAEGKYGAYHMAYCVHYVGDLSMPLHNIVYDEYNRNNHKQMDGIINGEVLENLSRIETYPIVINTEEDLVDEIVRIANLSIALANRLESENRQLTKNEAYLQVGHSASLLKGILGYAGVHAGN